MKIKKRHKFALFLLILLAIVLTAVLYQYAANSEMINPKGLIALQQLYLMHISTLLMLIVVIPVFILTFAICWKFRSSNKEAPYTPYWNHDTTAEVIWWGFPFAIILVLSFVTWISSHQLDPFKPLSETTVKPIKIQVVALDWKWLFIYPEEKIATVNFFQFPEKTPLNFEITSDAPMNSFWIPQLGGQIYAMPGMRTKLHLIADEPGSFRGSSANLSGEGFSGMTFIAKSSSRDEFEKWVQSVKTSSEALGMGEYKLLVKPSAYNPDAFYALKDEDLFDQILMKYMMPPKELQDQK